MLKVLSLILSEIKTVHESVAVRISVWYLFLLSDWLAMPHLYSL